ncbi:hypothetical protein ZHAS_00007396 [Anopheles sinensis]|uniref:Uncharacterized protein n=1 Tax=Anopheles sinensis TaxID=74873 RepID=A0A084VPW2_ANOSI|nr:hypothetical protein ZHAS_00007396 [Anopheles sinensis]
MFISFSFKPEQSAHQPYATFLPLDEQNDGVQRREGIKIETSARTPPVPSESENPIMDGLAVVAATDSVRFRGNVLERSVVSVEGSIKTSELATGMLGKLKMADKQKYSAQETIQVIIINGL